MQDFELQEIKWLNAKTNPPKPCIGYWALIRFDTGELRTFHVRYVGGIWYTLHVKGAERITDDMDIISFFELPDHEQAPTFDN